VAKQQVFRRDDAQSEESREGSDYATKEVDHRAILHPVVPQVDSPRAPAPAAPGASTFCGAQATSSISRGAENVDTPAGLSDSPYPRKSGATAKNPAFARARIGRRHVAYRAGKP
jgi:hypothetical protein